MSACSVAECDRVYAARGFCLMHYKRWRKWGDPLTVRPGALLPQDFWRRVDVTEPEYCWDWLSTAHAGGRTGYGWFRGKTAHRWAYELTKGPLAPGMVPDHLCRVRHCVNPAHLEAVTLGENTRRGGNAIKTHCPAGHPYDEANTYRTPDGIGRRCRECVRINGWTPERAEAQRRRRAAKKAGA